MKTQGISSADQEKLLELSAKYSCGSLISFLQANEPKDLI